MYVLSLLSVAEFSSDLTNIKYMFLDTKSCIWHQSNTHKCLSNFHTFLLWPNLLSSIITISALCPTVCLPLLLILFIPDLQTLRSLSASLLRVAELRVIPSCSMSTCLSRRPWANL